MPVQVTPYRGTNLTEIALNNRNFDAQQAQRATANSQRQQQLDQGQQRIGLTKQQLEQAAAKANLSVKQFGIELMNEAVGLSQTPEEAIARLDLVSPTTPEIQESLRNAPKELFGSGRTAGQRERSELTENLSPDDLDSANRIALNLDPKAGTQKPPQIVMIGNVPHQFDSSTQAMTPVQVSGQQVTSDTVADSERNIAEQVASGKAVVGRLGDAITEGQLAAESLPALNRAIELLETGVQTGGFTGAQLAIAKRLGVEDPETGELSNLLGKAVLSQLRKTFGAAFTAEEGKTLTSIEASFTNNPATNLRLLNNAKTVSMAAAQRGLRAAEQDGDQFAIDEINRFINQQLGAPQKQSGPQQQTSPGGVSFTVE